MRHSLVGWAVGIGLLWGSPVVALQEASEGQTVTQKPVEGQKTASCMPVDTTKGSTQATSSTLKPCLWTFLKLETETRVLAMDHRSASWSLWTCSSTGCKPRDLQVDATGAARINAADGPYRVVVVNTNSLVYSIQDRKAEDKDVPELAALQELVQQIGAGIQGLVSARTGVPFTAPSIPVMNAMSIPMPGADRLDAGPPPVDDDRVKLIKKLDVWRKAYGDSLGRVAAAAGGVAASQRINEVDKAALVRAIQDFETRGRAFEKPAMLRTNHLIDFKNLLNARHEARSLACLAQVSALDDLLELTSKVPPPSVAALPAALSERDGLAAAAIEKSDVCAEAPDLKLLSDIVNSVKGHTLGTVWTSAAEWVPLREAILAYEGVSSDAAAALKKVDELIGKMDALTGAGARIDETLRLITLAGNGVSVDMLDVSEPWSSPEWDQDRAVSFKVSATAPLQEGIVKFRTAPLEGKYALTNSWLSFDVSFGLLMVRPGSPDDVEWEAVTHPLDSSKKVIAATSRGTRSGAPTAILTLQSERLKAKAADLSPGLDLGVGLDPDRLFVSIGGSIKLASFLRIGFAKAWHRVSELHPSQTALEFGADNKVVPASITEVASTDDIRTVGRVRTGNQLYFVLSISKLNPFKKKD